MLLIYVLYCMCLTCIVSCNNIVKKMPAQQMECLYAKQKDCHKMPDLQMYAINDTIKSTEKQIEIEIRNNSDSTYIVGETYSVERFKNGKWVQVPYKQPKNNNCVYTFNDIAYILNPKTGYKHFTINLNRIRMGKEYGKYRIIKLCHTDISKICKTIYAEFMYIK
jgi:hypothetical protein